MQVVLSKIPDIDKILNYSHLHCPVLLSFLYRIKVQNTRQSGYKYRTPGNPKYEIYKSPPLLDDLDPPLASFKMKLELFGIISSCLETSLTISTLERKSDSNDLAEDKATNSKVITKLLNAS